MSVVTLEDGRRTARTRYVERIADSMELRDWRIVLRFDPKDEDSGFVRTTYGRKLATMQLDWTASKETIRHSTCHELIHLHMDCAANTIQNELSHFLEDAVDKAFFLAFNRQLELGVDGLATAIAKHQPLPPR